MAIRPWLMGAEEQDPIRQCQPTHGKALRTFGRVHGGAHGAGKNHQWAQRRGEDIAEEKVLKHKQVPKNEQGPIQ